MRLHGKVLAVGGYAVLAATGRGLALPVHHATMDVTVSVSSSGVPGSTVLVLRQNGVVSTLTISAADTSTYRPVEPCMSFVHAACLVSLAYTGKAHLDLQIAITTEHECGEGAKLGVGSSAMVSTGVTVELSRCFGANLSQEEIFILSHFGCLLVQGQSSGYDIAAVMNDTPIIYCQSGQYHKKMLDLTRQAHSGACLAALSDQLRMIAAEHELPRIIPVSLPPQFQCYLLKPKCLAGKATSTQAQVRKLSSSSMDDSSYKELVAVSAALVDQLTSENSTHRQVTESIQEYRAAQQRFSDNNKLSIEPLEIRNFINDLRKVDGVLGAMCIGAGGYDAFLCITAKSFDRSAFVRYIVIDLNY